MGATRIPCVFETVYETYSGARVALLGDVPELGAWFPSNALYASDEGGKKIVRVDLPVGSTAYFKWTLIDPAGDIVKWEETPNKRLIIPECEHMRIVAPWNNSPTIKFVTSSHKKQVLSEGMQPEVKPDVKQSPAQPPVQQPVKSPNRPPVKSPLQPPVKLAVQPHIKTPLKSPVKPAVQRLLKTPLQSPVKSAVHPPVKPPLQPPVKPAVQPTAKSHVHPPVKSSVQPHVEEKFVTKQETKRTNSRSWILPVGVSISVILIGGVTIAMFRR